MDRLEEMKDLVYELRHSDGAGQVVQLRETNSRLHGEVSGLRRQLDQIKQSSHMKRDGQGFLYDETDVLAYFTAMIKTKDSKIEVMMREMKEQQKREKETERETTRLREEVAFMRKQSVHP